LKPAQFSRRVGADEGLLSPFFDRNGTVHADRSLRFGKQIAGLFRPTPDLCLFAAVDRKGRLVLATTSLNCLPNGSGFSSMLASESPCSDTRTFWRQLSNSFIAGMPRFLAGSS
jgi:hypothetical protein